MTSSLTSDVSGLSWMALAAEEDIGISIPAEHRQKYNTLLQTVFFNNRIFDQIIRILSGLLETQRYSEQLGIILDFGLYVSSTSTNYTCVFDDRERQINQEYCGAAMLLNGFHFTDIWHVDELIDHIRGRYHFANGKIASMINRSLQLMFDPYAKTRLSYDREYDLMFIREFDELSRALFLHFILFNLEMNRSYLPAERLVSIYQLVSQIPIELNENNPTGHMLVSLQKRFWEFAYPTFAQKQAETIIPMSLTDLSLTMDALKI